jgi:hypothetical protein
MRSDSLRLYFSAPAGLREAHRIVRPGPPAGGLEPPGDVVVVDEVVAVDRDRPELAGDRGLRAGAEPDPCGLELGEVAAQQQGIERDRRCDDGLGHDALAGACRAAAVVVVLDADRAAVDERRRVAVVPGA